MPNSVIPVLSIGQDQLTRPVDQIAYILRHAFYNPGWTSSYIEPYLISLQKLYAECNHQLEDMVARLKEKLTYALENLYGDDYRVTMEIYNVDDITKGVRVRITDKNGNIALSSDDIRIENGECYIRQTLAESEEN